MLRVNNNIILRPWELKDKESLSFHGNNPKIAANMTDAFPYPYSLEAAESFIEMVKDSFPPNILAIDVNGEACGGIGIHPSEGLERINAELGYWLGEQFWNRGVLSLAIPVMVRYAFQNWPIERIYARPFGRNTASCRVLEKSGFMLEARFEKTLIKNGILEDELVYAIRKKG